MTYSAANMYTFEQVFKQIYYYNYNLFHFLPTRVMAYALLNMLTDIHIFVYIKLHMSNIYSFKVY